MRVDSNEPLPILGAVRVRPVAGAAPAAGVRATGAEERPGPNVGDQAEISPVGQAHQSHRPGSAEADQCPLCRRDAAEASEPVPESASEPASEPATGTDLAPEEQQEVAQLQARDLEVRAHEQAHHAAAGELATGGPSFETETGPDGRAYAVGGEVPIELRSGASPEETIRLAQQAQRAALAPAQPSAQDQAVAAQAAQRVAEARAEAYQATGESEQEPILGSVFA